MTLVLTRILMLCFTRHYKRHYSRESENFDIVLFQIYWSTSVLKIIKIELSFAKLLQTHYDVVFWLTVYIYQTKRVNSHDDFVAMREPYNVTSIISSLEILNFILDFSATRTVVFPTEKRPPSVDGSQVWYDWLTHLAHLSPIFTGGGLKHLNLAWLFYLSRIWKAFV